MTTRTEFGIERSSCSCRDCRRYCMYMPGFLIPADLERLIPDQADPFVWADANLLASPGAVVRNGLHLFRIPTLVPAVKPDGSCIHYKHRKCEIWENSPFGCAFFGCEAKAQDKMSTFGLNHVYLAQNDPQSLYSRIWHHLWDTGKQQEAPETIRARMNEHT